MNLSLYLITDSRGMDETEFFNKIEKAVSSGVTMVQLREKELSSREFFERAMRLKKICSDANVPLIINDRIDIAQAANADGVHLGTSDLPVFVARKILGDDKIIGATAKTADAVIKAANDGADYFGIGAFFATDTKSDAYTMTPDQIRAVTDIAPIPAVGIGGLTYENLYIRKNSGVKGAAISDAIMRAENVSETVRLLREKVDCLTRE